MREKPNCKNEESILDTIRSGDSECFNQAVACLYQKTYQRPLWHFVKRQGGSRADFEDLYQEVIIRAVKKIKNRTYQNEGKLGAYLYGIGRYVWGDLKKREAYYEQLDRHLPKTSEGVAEEQRAWYDIVIRCLEKIGEPCASIIRKHWLREDGLSVVAEEMGYTYGSIRHKYRKCWKELVACCHRSKD